MATEITVPTLGESVTEGTIGEWLKQPGDAIKEGDLIMDGDPSLTRSVSAWLRPSIFVNSPREAGAV